MQEFHVGHCFFTGSGTDQTISGNLYVRINDNVKVIDDGHSEKEWQDNLLGIGEQPAIVYWSNIERKLIVDFTKTTSDNSYIPIETVNNDAYLHSCDCPVCGQSMFRGWEEKNKFCVHCGTYLTFPNYSKEETDQALAALEFDDYEDT